MSTIFFTFFLKVIFFVSFFFSSLWLIFKFYRKKILLDLVIGSVFFLISINNLIKLVNYPSVNKSKNYYTSINNIKSSNIKNVFYKKISINKKKYLKRKIKNDNLINDLLESIQNENVPKIFFFENHSPENIYNFYFETKSNKNYIIRIEKTKTNLTVIKLIFYDNVIGKYANYKIKNILKKIDNGTD